ncbi:hypothetical protein GCM10029978_110250 [Actinoallomurus acanthiterrae]
MRITLKKACGAVATFAAVAASAAATAPSAQAAPARPTCVINPSTGNCSYPSCSGTGCDHTDPYSTGCAVGSYRVFPRDANGLELWWSPACKTNWVVVVSRLSESFYVERGSDHAEASWAATGGGWTDQLYAPGAARGCTSIWDGRSTWSTPECTPWTS